MAYPADGLTTANYTTLQTGSYAAIQYLSLLPETVIQTANITSTHSSGSYASVTLAATVSADVKVGHTVIVEKQSTTFSGYIQLYITRVRKAPSGTTLYIAEEFWPIFQETTYRVRIIDDFRIQPKLARESGGTYYKDYDTTFHVMRPIITGLQSAYAGFISGSNLTLSFDAVGVPVETGATISTYLWDVDDGTITVGTSASASITATFPAGFRWVSLTVTDSNTQSTTRRIPVWAHDTSTNAPEITIEGVQITRDMNAGDSARLTVLGDRTDYTEARLCVLWRREWYNGTETNIVSNIDFIGRVAQSEIGFGGNQEHGVLVDDTPVLLEGIKQQLERVTAPIISTTNVTVAATAWDDIQDNTFFRALVHILNEHSTFLELHDFSISRVDEFSTIADYPMQFWSTEQGTILNAVNSLAYSISNAALEIAPTGESKITPHRGIYHVYQYKSLDFTETDVIDATLGIEWSPKKAKAEGSAGAYNSGVTDVAIASVPESAPSSGGDIITLEKQVFNSNTTLSAQLETRLNNLLEFENLQTNAQIVLPDGYHFIQPSRQHTTSFDLPASLTGFSYNALKMICNQMSISHDNLSGSRDVQSQWRAVNLNAGVNDTSQVSDTYFTYRTVVAWISSTVWLTTNFFDADVVWTDVTPTLDADETVKHCILTRDGASSTIRLHILTYMSDTTEGRVWTIDDAQNMNSTPTAGATTAGNFRKMIPALPVTGTTPFAVIDFDSDTKPIVKPSTNWGVSYSPTTPASNLVAGYGAHGRNANTLVGTDTDIEIATTHGGAFSSYLAATGSVDMIHIPEDEMTGTDVLNSTTTPDLFYSLSSTGALKRVTANGVTTTDVTPNDGTNNGVMSGEFGLSTPKNNYFAKLTAGIFTFGSTPKLAIDYDAYGGSWDEFVTLTSGTVPYVRTAYRGSGPPWLVYYNDNDTPTYMELDSTTSTILNTYTRPIPGNSTALLGIEVLES